jgi:hypothetical protein
VRLDWTQPPRGSVRVLRSPRPLPHAPGTQLTFAEAEQLEAEWLGPLGPDRAEDADPPSTGFCYYTPLLALGGTLVVGHAAALSRLTDPADLRATRLGGAGDDRSASIRVQLRWRWSAEASTTRVVARWGSPPQGPSDPLAIVAAVTRDEYERMGAWVLTLPRSGLEDSSDSGIQPTEADSMLLPSDRWHVSVYSVAEVDGDVLVSAGLEQTATIAVPGPHPEVTVSYQLRRPWFPGRQVSIVLHAEPRGSMVPPMVLVANPRAIPLSAEDGEIVARLPLSLDGATYPIPDPSKIARGGVRAFPDPTADPSTCPPIRIRHPDTGQTRL